MIRVAMLSFWHVHAEMYLRQIAEHPEMTLTAAWDCDVRRGKRKAEDLGIPFFDDLDALLESADIDGVIVNAPTTMHRDVIVAAANAGKHVFTEKVLAPTGQECREIVRAVDESDVVLVVSLPHLYAGYTAEIREQIGRGTIGDVTSVRTRMSHDGAIGDAWLASRFFERPSTGGGAMIDLGCHPMYLARLFLGDLPSTVSVTFGTLTHRAVEDNAAALLTMANGAFGVVEASFVSASPLSIEVFGTTGSMHYGTPKRELWVGRDSREPEWRQLPIPEPSPGPLDQWAAHIQTGAKAEENVALALDLTSLMEAANLADDEREPAPVRKVVNR